VGLLVVASLGDTTAHIQAAIEPRVHEGARAQYSRGTKSQRQQLQYVIYKSTSAFNMAVPLTRPRLPTASDH